MAGRLEDKVATITGSGVGETTARRFAAESPHTEMRSNIGARSRALSLRPRFAYL